jgi:hypothetical protein
MLKANGVILELSSSVKGAPPLIELVRTLSAAHATWAVVACAQQRPFFASKSLAVRA